MYPTNRTRMEPDLIEPDMRADPTFHLLSIETASARDSLLFIGVMLTHGAELANEFAVGFDWDLSALREWKQFTPAIWTVPKHDW